MNEIVRHRTSADTFDPISKSEYRLRIHNIDRVYDKNKGQLVLLVRTKEMLDTEVTAFLKENQLILESPVQLDYNKPYHMKLSGGEAVPKSEFDFLVIGFSEIKLKPGYHYSLISCQLIHPTLVKIILTSKISFMKSYYSKTSKNKRRK